MNHFEFVSVINSIKDQVHIPKKDDAKTFATLKQTLAQELGTFISYYNSKRYYFYSKV